MFEHRSQRLLPRRAFYRRLGRSLVLGAGILLVGLGLGITGYHIFENMPWLDAFVNARDRTDRRDHFRGGRLTDEEPLGLASEEHGHDETWRYVAVARSRYRP